MSSNMKGHGSKSAGRTKSSVCAGSSVGHGSKLRRKQDAAIAALATCRTIEEAARRCGVAKSTLCRWQELPEFRERQREANRQARAHADAILQGASATAAGTLVVMMAPTNPPAVRTRAAESVLKHGLAAAERDDTEKRVSSLEQTLARHVSTTDGPGIPELFRKPDKPGTGQ